MSQTSGHFSAPSPLVALCGWLVPGSGYLLIGQTVRGLVIGVTILVLFTLGVLIAGIRVIDVPGYDDRGSAVYVNAAGQKSMPPGPGDRWSLRARPFAEVANKPWFVGQILAGPVCLIGARWSLDVSKPTEAHPSAVPRSHGRIAEIGTLYTAIAGMLNLLATLDAAWRASQGGA
jgi:hypothetical protein